MQITTKADIISEFFFTQTGLIRTCKAQKHMGDTSDYGRYDSEIFYYLLDFLMKIAWSFSSQFLLQTHSVDLTQESLENLESRLKMLLTIENDDRMSFSSADSI